MKLFTLLSALALAMTLNGCSLLTTTADGIAAIGEGVTQSTASTSDATTTEGEEAAGVEQARVYVRSQHALIRRDAAAGQGEHLTALATLLGERDTEAFGRWMQQHYGALFDHPNTADRLVDDVLEMRRPSPAQQASL